MHRKLSFVLLTITARAVTAFLPSPTQRIRTSSNPAFRNINSIPRSGARVLRDTLCRAQPEKDIVNSDELFDGFTAKQRLREEIESPFRKVRLFFFGSSTASALLALYFSVINAGKAYVGGWPDAPPLDDALTSCAINVAATAVCATITLNDLRAGKASLNRIAKGGALAKLAVAAGEQGVRTNLSQYRRGSRILIAAGGPEYISLLAQTLTSSDGGLAAQVASVDLVIVPVLLESGSVDSSKVGDTRTLWANAVSTKSNSEEQSEETVAAAASVVAFPIGADAWYAYLQSEIETAKTQGFDVLEKGITITIKKNGRILRRATGQPQWSGLVGAMEVMDGKFGMPGDDEQSSSA